MKQTIHIENLSSFKLESLATHCMHIFGYVNGVTPKLDFEKPNAKAACLYLNKHFDLQRQDMVLWRVFPNTKKYSIDEIRERNVYVTSLTDFQSWSKSDRDRFFKIFQLREPSSKGIPLSIAVQANIPKECILLDIRSDFIPIVKALMDHSKYLRDQLSDAFDMLLQYVEEEEIFVNLKQKEIKVIEAIPCRY